MWNSLVSVLLLVAVSSSTSNVLPMMTTSDLQILLDVDVDGQPNDNTLSNTQQFYNIFYTPPLRAIDSRQRENDDEANEITQPSPPGAFREENYDFGGFRKEQWHNYPRQLDRLQKHARDRLEKSTPDDLRLRNTLDYTMLKKILNTNVYDTRYKLRPRIFHETRKTETVESENPIEEENAASSKTYRTANDYGDLSDEEAITQDIFPVIKLNKEGDSLSLGDSESNYSPKKSKRLFSLWSRLQSMSYKGHELPHRRHMALYAMAHPSRMAHTAETRALMRPPGSPLRWG